MSSDETFDPGFDILASLDSLDLVIAEYESEIHDMLDWQGIVNDASDPGQHVGAIEYGLSFIGTVFALSPSGKYYTPWACSNVDMPDAVLDQCFYEALDTVAQSWGGWIESSDGDPCDLFFGISLD